MTQPLLAPTDEQVLDYLLGVLPDEVTQRVDELSLVDDQFALRLRVAEHDLFDDYAAGRLSGARLEQFTANGRWTPGQREKLMVARLLHRAPGSSAGRVGHRWPAGLAMAASIVLVVGTWALVERTRSRDVPIEKGTPVAAARPRAANPPTPVPPPATPETSGVVSMVLLPSTRGIADIPAITMPSATSRLELKLTLESNDFPLYQAVLEDPATRRPLWTSARLPAETTDRAATVPIAVPIALRAQRYVIDLRGFPARGPSQILSSYAFRVVQ